MLFLLAPSITMTQSRVSESWLFPNMDHLIAMPYPCSFVSKTITLVYPQTVETRWFHVFPDIQESVDLRAPIPFRLVLLTRYSESRNSLFFLLFALIYACALRWDWIFGHEGYRFNLPLQCFCYFPRNSLLGISSFYLHQNSQHTSLERLISCLDVDWVDVRGKSTRQVFPFIAFTIPQRGPLTEQLLSFFFLRPHIPFHLTSIFISNHLAYLPPFLSRVISKIETYASSNYPRTYTPITSPYVYDDTIQSY